MGSGIGIWDSFRENPGSPIAEVGIMKNYTYDQKFKPVFYRVPGLSRSNPGIDVKIWIPGLRIGWDSRPVPVPTPGYNVSKGFLL